MLGQDRTPTLGLLLALGLASCAPSMPAKAPHVPRAHLIPLSAFLTYPPAERIEGPLCSIVGVCEHRSSRRPLVVEIEAGVVRVFDEVIVRYDPVSAAILPPTNGQTAQQVLVEVFGRTRTAHSERDYEGSTTIPRDGRVLFAAHRDVPVAVVSFVAGVASRAGFRDPWFLVRAEEGVLSPAIPEPEAPLPTVGFPYETCRVVRALDLATDGSISLDRADREPLHVDPIGGRPDVDGALAALSSDPAVASVVVSTSPRVSMDAHAQVVSAVAAAPTHLAIEVALEREVRPPLRRRRWPGRLIHALPLVVGSRAPGPGCPAPERTRCVGVDGVWRDIAAITQRVDEPRVIP
jgi:hypothetical protein